MTTSSSHRPRPRLHRIERAHVFIALTMTTSSSHRPRLHHIDHDHVFIALTTTTSSSHRPRPRLHRIDHDHVFIALTTTTSSYHLCINFDKHHIVCDCHLCTAHMAPACRPMLMSELCRSFLAVITGRAGFQLLAS